MAIVAVSSIAHDAYIIGGFENAPPSTAVSGNVVGQSMYSRVTLSDPGGTTIGNTANWSHTYGLMNQSAGVSDANSYYLRDEAGNLFRVEEIHGGGGTYTNAETSPSVVTSVHTRALVLQPVDDQGVNIPGSSMLTTYVPAGAYNAANYIQDDLVDSINITSMGVGTSTGNMKTTNPTGDPVIPCFTTGAMILTKTGEVPVEDLHVGDLVKTASNGFQAIRWIGSRKLDSIDLTLYPKLRPICIKAGSLGAELPTQDLVVSRQHRMLIASIVALRVCNEDQVLVPAIKLVEHPDINIVQDTTEVEYFHIAFDAHQVIFANGAPTESFYLGKQALKAITPEAYAEIITLFPEVEETEFESASARLIPAGKQQKQLIARHIKNSKDFVSLQHFV